MTRRSANMTRHESTHDARRAGWCREVIGLAGQRDSDQQRSGAGSSPRRARSSTKVPWIGQRCEPPEEPRQRARSWGTAGWSAEVMGVVSGRELDHFGGRPMEVLRPTVMGLSALGSTSVLCR